MSMSGHRLSAMWRAVRAVVQGLFCFCALTGVGIGVARAAGADAFPSEIRIGVQKGDGLIALRASGQLEKVFAPLHVKVKWIEFVYGEPLIEAINAGDIDVGTVGSTPPILAQAGKAPEIVYVAYSPRLRGSYGLIVPAGSSIKTIRDLKGKRIAFANGSQGHLFLLKALADAGVDPASTQLTRLAYSDARAAFERGYVDAWVVPDPRYADTELASGARTILTIGQLSVPQYGFYVAPRSFASRYPAALRVLFDTLAKQTAHELAHPDETAVFLSQNTGVPLRVWQRALPRLDWGVAYPLTDDVIRAQQDAANLAFDSHLITRAIDVRQAVVDIGQR